MYEPYDVVHDVKCGMMRETQSNLAILPIKHFYLFTPSIFFI
jgi:hypothetical protein